MNVMSLDRAKLVIEKLGHRVVSITIRYDVDTYNYAIRSECGCVIRINVWAISINMFTLSINMFRVPVAEETWKQVPEIWCPRLRILL
jgi:hypothetical protein